MKVMDMNAYAEQLDAIESGVNGYGLKDIVWSRGITVFERMLDAEWDVVINDFPPLIAAAHKHGRPEKFIGGRAIYSLVAKEELADFFARKMAECMQPFKDLLATSAQQNLMNRSPYDREKALKGYKRFREFWKAVGALGIKEYRTEFTDYGMSANDAKALDAFLKQLDASVTAAKAPAPTEALFAAPKKGKYPAFSDNEYAQYMNELRSKYLGVLENMTGFGGMSLGETQIEDMMKKLEGFDYAEICATLGAQKRRPPKDDYDNNGKMYEFLAKLPQLVGKSFDEKTAGNVHSSIKASVESLNRNDRGARNAGFKSLRLLKDTLAWLERKFPGLESQALADARAAVAREYDPRWAAMSAGAVHEKHMGEIRFSNSATLPPGDAEWAETLNPAKEAVYGHIFLKQALGNLGDMYFVKMGDQWLQASKKVMSNPDSAYQVLQLFPDPALGRDPELVQAFGKALEAAASGGELAVEFSPNTRLQASGTLNFKMTKADAGKIAARAKELAAAAEANLTAEAVLPEIFARKQPWPYKDKVLSPENLKTAIEAAWEYDRKQKIDVKHLRVNHYRPGHEWDQEVDPLNRPTQRLTFSYVAMIYEHDGKTYAVEDGIQFRQFYMMGKGYGDDLNVLFWNVSPFALPSEQVKRVTK